MSLTTMLKTFKLLEIASISFYAVAGIILLVFLPFTGFPPHLGFLGSLSLITAYSLFIKRAWAPWLVASLLIINTGFSMDILFSIGFSNMIVALSMFVYEVLTLIFTAYLMLKRKD